MQYGSKPGVPRWVARSLRTAACALMMLMAGMGPALAALPSQPGGTPDAPPESPSAAVDATASYFNRDIITYRAAFLGIPPQQRALNTEASIERAVSLPGTAVIGSHEIPQGVVITLSDIAVLVLTPDDLDPVGGETLEQAREAVVGRLGEAVRAAESELEPRYLLRGLLYSLLATALLVAALWGYRWLVIRWHAWLEKLIQKRLAATHAEAGRQLIRGMATALRWIVRIAEWVLVLVLLEEWLRYVLGQFAYTRPWADAMTGWILLKLKAWGGALLGALPGLLTVVVIFLLTRAITRTLSLMLKGVERGRYSLLGIDAQLAEPTRKLMIAVIWLFALAMAYPYLPGAQTDAFKGLSVLVGLMVSLGASSIIGQAAGGFTLLYSRTMQPGDFVKIDDTEGMVVQIGLFTTRLRTFTGVEVSFPNTVVLNGRLENYSRHPEGPGLWMDTGLTIGYDTPWRQVQRLLLQAARETDGVQAAPEPFVLQTALSDFYVEYTLRTRIEDPMRRNAIRTDLLGRIQDAFNTAGVQIMSPNYRADSEEPKLVAREFWEGLPVPGASGPATGGADGRERGD
ncbi:mechanosensitive ion channel family protein [Marilutibacter aestuarii]|uniref:Small-conductance mechanosensitive channel n=1 Tax=Marilutibacter aestuarii TaxID=1706195 RepID=A0A508ADE9_9GAMM|nr:mechanosensitive ion channel family protein [Lysobacter aestuarii]TQD45808.1 mechanosensitive ion channel family protein [Lysobacter aestuarii]